MFLPLGAGPGRKLFPLVTVVLIAINALVHIVTIPRVERDDRRYGKAMMHLAMVELQIRSATGGGGREIMKLFGLRREDRRDEDFWRKFEAGRIAAPDTPIYQDWTTARQEAREARRAHLHWQWGFRKDAPSPQTAIASAFLHGGWMHLLGNMLFLWIVGANMEEVWGRRTFVLLYVLGILASGLAIFLESSAIEPVPGIGASGAIAAVMGAFLVRHFKRPIRVWSVVPMPAVYSVPAFVLLPAWFVAQIVALSDSDVASSGVGYGVHALGFVVGAAVALALKWAGAEGVVEAPQVAERKRLDREAKVAAIEKKLLANDTKGALEAMAKLLESDPEDLATRARKMEMHLFIGDKASARTEALDLLERTWRTGQRSAYAALFERVDAMREGAMPVLHVHRAAMAMEAIDAHAAGALYVRVAREGAGDPIVRQSLQRYAALLEKNAEPEKAAQVRAMIERVKA